MRHEKSVPAGRRSLRRSRGIALLAFLAALVVVGLAFFIGNLTPQAIEARRAQSTDAALARAREALLWYGVTFRDEQNRIKIADGQPPDNYVYGYLPLPDLGTDNNTNIGCPWEGCDANLSGSALNKTVVGRFPWRLFGTEPLRDGYGECLWYIVSGSHQRIEKAVPMNWDTLGQIDIVTTNGVDPAKLRSLIATAHDRPVAIIFSPGPVLEGQNRGVIGTNDVTQCGGNYTPANYLEPNLAAALLDYTGNPTVESAYFSGATTTNNTHLTNLAIETQGKVYKDGAALRSACPPGSANCILSANDVGLPLGGDTLFGAIRKNANFRIDINSMLDRMATCLQDRFASGGIPSLQAPSAEHAEKWVGRIPDDTCYGDDENPKNYFSHYKDQFFLAACKIGDCLNVTVDSIARNCRGVLVFSSQRGTGQSRLPTDKNTPSNYLEGSNLLSFTSEGQIAFSGPSQFAIVSPTHPAQQDIVRCIPSGPSFTTVISPTLESLGFGQLVAYDASTRTLTLGRANLTTAEVGTSNASALFGSAWLADTRTVGRGLRTYFRFQFKKVGTNVGFNGFVFAMADATRNGFQSAGAAGSHLGYSGNNGITPMIDFPKIGIEFDQGYNPGFPGTDGESSVQAGRNDPCGSRFCGGTHGFNSHAAIVYWGHDASGADGVNLPNFDDNVHGFPTVGSLPAVLNPPPRSHANPATESGVKFINMRGYPNNDYDSRIFHTRIELTRVPPAQLSPVRTTEGTNVNLASPGPSLGGVTLSAGNRVLLQSQSNPAENGVYIWNGPTTPLTRSTDADQISELTNASVTVTEGTYINSVWRQSSTIAAVDTDPQVWQPFVEDFSVQVWIEGDASLTNQINALRNTTRSVAELYPGYTPTLSDTPRLFGIPGGPCDALTPCPSGQACASGNVCYRPAMQKIQLGFTNSQRTTDQEITINDFFTTWLP